MTERLAAVRVERLVRTSDGLSLATAWRVRARDAACGALARRVCRTWGRPSRDARGLAQRDSCGLRASAAIWGHGAAETPEPNLAILIVRWSPTERRKGDLQIVLIYLLIFVLVINPFRCLRYSHSIIFHTHIISQQLM